MHGAKVQINGEPRKQFRDYFYDLSITLAFYLTPTSIEARLVFHTATRSQKSVASVESVRKNCIGSQRRGYVLHRFLRRGGQEAHLLSTLTSINLENRRGKVGDYHLSGRPPHQDDVSAELSDAEKQANEVCHFTNGQRTEGIIRHNPPRM